MSSRFLRPDKSFSFGYICDKWMQNTVPGRTQNRERNQRVYKAEEGMFNPL